LRPGQPSKLWSASTITTDDTPSEGRNYTCKSSYNTLMILQEILLTVCY